MIINFGNAKNFTFWLRLFLQVLNMDIVKNRHAPSARSKIFQHYYRIKYGACGACSRGNSPFLAFSAAREEWEKYRLVSLHCDRCVKLTKKLKIITRWRCAEKVPYFLIILRLRISMLKNLNLFWQRVVRRRRRIAKYRFRAFKKFKSGILQFPQEVVMHLAPCAGCRGTYPWNEK